MYTMGNKRVLFSNKSQCLLLPLKHKVNDSVAKCNVMHHTKCISCMRKQLFQNERNRPHGIFYFNSFHLSGGEVLRLYLIDLR